MTLQKHYQSQQRHLDIARKLADTRDRVALAVRFRRIPTYAGNFFQFCLTQDIMQHLTCVQYHAAEIETKEALLSARRDREHYDRLIQFISAPARPQAPRPAAATHKVPGFCDRCQVTGIDPLSADGQQLNCRHCNGTGLNESAA